ncbi:MAG TPA: ATP-binding protein [Gemmatimonadales bacterium]|jgi:hypothetical protein|nr:ATP-binding protein [Gemmatimonadales bacterium]
MKSSIEWRLPATVGGLVLLVTLALSWAAYIQVRAISESAAADRLLGLATQVAAGAQPQTVVVKQRMHSTAAIPAIAAVLHAGSATPRSPDWVAARHALLGDTSASLVAASLWDVDGKLVAATDSSVDASASPTVRTTLLAQASGPDSATIGPTLAHGDSIVYPVVAVVTLGGHRVGYAVEWSRVKRNKRAREQIGTLLGASAVLYIGSTPGAWTDQEDVIPAPPLNLAHPGNVVHYTGSGKESRLIVGARIAGTPWVVALESSDAIILAPARRFLTRIAIVSAVVFAIGLLLAWLLSRHISLPLRIMTAAADARATGEYSVRVPVTGTDELGRLAVAFNEMADYADAEADGRRASEAQWRVLFQTNPHPMWVYDSNSYRFLAVNDATVAKYGYTAAEFDKLLLPQLYPESERARVEEILAGLKDDANRLPLTDSAWHHRRKDGSLLEVQVDANSLSFNGRRARLVLAQDVTDRRVLEQQLRQGQRMEAVGRLAGGVAHDFNNVLTVVMACTQLLQEGAKADSFEAEELASILEAAERAQTLTRQLLALSKQQVLQPIVLDPNAAVNHLRGLLDRVIGEDVVFETELDSDVGAILVDPGQLEQVLLNLAVNARDAMPSGGHLTITTSAVDLDQAGSALHGLTQTGRFVVISVADTGVGMTPETRGRIFDPFFTTKDVGKGTGLGLATVYGIVTQSGGAVTVYSEPGLGSTFRVYFPRADAPVAATMIAAEPASVRGTETILLVEDELSVRRTVTHVLERLGYNVIAAGNGEEALALATSHTGALDLVVSDVVMPGLDGPSLVNRLRETRPSLRALLLSGYSGDAVASRGFAKANAAFLQKPFSLAALSHKVREALEGVAQSVV